MKNTSSQQQSVKAYEMEIIRMVVDIGRLIGLPKSVCEIYGLLVAVIDPLSMEEICGKLEMSLGSVSQGLRLLKDLGAVRTVCAAGQRRDSYLAEFNFRQIVTRYLSEKIHPTLESAEDRFLKIESMISNLPEETKDDISERISRIRRLNRRANQVIPAVSKILSL